MFGFIESAMYKNLGGDSGVDSYEIKGSLGFPVPEKTYESIEVSFRQGRHTEYLYTLDSVGPWRLSAMISDARHGQGLNGFINRYCYDDYESRK